MYPSRSLHENAWPFFFIAFSIYTHKQTDSQRDRETHIQTYRQTDGLFFFISFSSFWYSTQTHEAHDCYVCQSFCLSVCLSVSVSECTASNIDGDVLQYQTRRASSTASVVNKHLSPTSKYLTLKSKHKPKHLTLRSRHKSKYKISVLKHSPSTSLSPSTNVTVNSTSLQAVLWTRYKSSVLLDIDL